MRVESRKTVRLILSLTAIWLLMMVWHIIPDEAPTAPRDADADADADADVIVYVSASCSCYRPWISDLRRDGLAVNVVQTRDIVKAQQALGVPREFSACHTADAKNYWIEGHVPAESIMSLLNGAPENVAGLAHLRADLRPRDEIAWEVVTYDAKGEPISSVPQLDSSTENAKGATHEQ